LWHCVHWFVKIRFWRLCPDGNLFEISNSTMKMLNILIGVVVAAGVPRMMLAQSPSAQNAIMAVQITKARKANAASDRRTETER